MQRAVWLWIGILAFGLWVYLSGVVDAAYRWRTLDVGIDVETSGDLLITETQHYDVTDEQALRLKRTISLADVDHITDVEVLENSQALAVKTGLEDEQFHIRWWAPSLPAHQSASTRTFVVRYRVQGGVRVHPDGDQIAWTALFGGRDTPLPQGAVTLRVPSELAGEIQDSKSYGVPAAVQTRDARTLSFVPSTALQPDEALKVKVVVPHGRLKVNMPKWQQGIDVPYTLPGLIGRIDTAVLIVLGIGMLLCLYYAISSTLYEDQNEMAQTMGLDRDDGTYRPGDRTRQPPY